MTEEEPIEEEEEEEEEEDEEDEEEMPDTMTNPPRTPLQILVIRNAGNDKTQAYVTVLRYAFEGSSDDGRCAGRYLDLGRDTGIRVLDLAGLVSMDRNELDIDRNSLQAVVQGAQCNVLVIIEDGSEDDVNITQLQNALGEIATETPAGRSAPIVIKRVIAQIPGPVADGPIQRRPTGGDGFEPALHREATALRAMEAARQALHQQLNADEAGAPPPPQFFISHAKVDGVPPAQSILRTLMAFAGEHFEPPTDDPDDDRIRSRWAKERHFAYFYDAVSLQAGDDWRAKIDAAARNAIMLVLRTEEYEGRYWCRTEFRTAECAGMPILVVDLRVSQFFGSAQLNFDAMPTVRLFDGNTLRVLFHALRINLLQQQEALRRDKKDRQRLCVLPFRPTTEVIHALCHQARKSDRPKTLVTPFPPVSDAIKRMAPKGTTWETYVL